MSESPSTQLLLFLAELSRARNGAPWVIKFGYMYPRNFGCDKIARPSPHVMECEISLLLAFSPKHIQFIFSVVVCAVSHDCIAGLGVQLIEVT